MTTQKFFQKTMEIPSKNLLSKGITLCENYLSPLFSITGSIAKTKSLVESGLEPTISDLLIPHIVMTFIPKLLANGLYHRFDLTQKDVVLYIIGFIISIISNRTPVLTYFAGEINEVAKIFGFTKLKNSTEDSFKLFAWTIVCDFAGMFISRLVMKKKLRISETDLFNMVFIYIGIFYIRVRKLNDYFVLLVVNIIPLSIKAVEYLKSKKKSKEKEEAPTEKKIKRKASVASKLDKNK